MTKKRGATSKAADNKAGQPDIPAKIVEPLEQQDSQPDIPTQLAQSLAAQNISVRNNSQDILPGAADILAWRDCGAGIYSVVSIDGQKYQLSIDGGSNE